MEYAHLRCYPKQESLVSTSAPLKSSVKGINVVFTPTVPHSELDLHTAKKTKIAITMSILYWFNGTVAWHKGSGNQLEKLLHPFLGLCLFFIALLISFQARKAFEGWKQLPGAVIKYFLMHSTSRSWLTLAMRQRQDDLRGSREIVLNSVPFTDTLCTQNIRTASVQFSVNTNLICQCQSYFLYIF